MNIEVKNISDFKIEITRNTAVLAYFYNDNCAPCQSLRPKMIKLLQEEFPLVKLIFINSEILEISAHHGVFDKPTLIVFFEQKEYIRESKYVSIVKLQENIERYYKILFE